MALKIFQTRRANLTQESQHSWSLIWRSTTVTISLPLLYVFYKATMPILCLRPITKPKFPTTIEFPQSDLCLHYFPTIFMLFNLTMNFVEFLEQPSSLTATLFIAPSSLGLKFISSRISSTDSTWPLPLSFPPHYWSRPLSYMHSVSAMLTLSIWMLVS